MERTSSLDVFGLQSGENYNNVDIRYAPIRLYTINHLNMA